MSDVDITDTSNWARWALEVHAIIIASGAQVKSVTTIHKPTEDPSDDSMRYILERTLENILDLPGDQTTLADGRVALSWEGNAQILVAAAKECTREEAHDIAWFVPKRLFGNEQWLHCYCNERYDPEKLSVGVRT